MPLTKKNGRRGDPIPCVVDKKHGRVGDSMFVQSRVSKA